MGLLAAAFLIGLGAAVVDFAYLALVVAPVLLRFPWLLTHRMAGDWHRQDPP